MANAGIVYKILTAAQWEEALRLGHYAGSADDERDGFIHLSARDQLAGTAAKHFKGKAGLVLVSLDSSRLGDGLVWEPSRGGALFPHLYTPLDVTAALDVTAMPLGEDGVPVLPTEFYGC
jgi:uncharacterized protein (DUF952 family)